MPIAFDNVTPDTASGAGVFELTTPAPWTIAGSDRVLFGFMATGDATAAAHTGGDDGMFHPAAGSVIDLVHNLAISTHARLSVWFDVAPPAASNDTRGEWAASQGEAGIGAVSYTGVDQTTPYDVASVVSTTGAVSSATTATATIDVTTEVGDMVQAVAFLHLTTGAVNPTVTEGAGCTPRYDLESAQMGGFAAVMFLEQEAVDTTTTMSADFAFTTASGTWGIVAYIVNPAAEGGAAPIDEAGWYPTEPQTNPSAISVW